MVQYLNGQNHSLTGLHKWQLHNLAIGKPDFFLQISNGIPNQDHSAAGKFNRGWMPYSLPIWIVEKWTPSCFLMYWSGSRSSTKDKAQEPTLNKELFEFRTSKSLVIKCFQYSNGWYWEPLYMKNWMSDLFKFVIPRDQLFTCSLFKSSLYLNFN